LKSIVSKYQYFPDYLVFLSICLCSCSVVCLINASFWYSLSVTVSFFQLCHAAVQWLSKNTFVDLTVTLSAENHNIMNTVK